MQTRTAPIVAAILVSGLLISGSIIYVGTRRTADFPQANPSDQPEGKRSPERVFELYIPEAYSWKLRTALMNAAMATESRVGEFGGDYSMLTVDRLAFEKEPNVTVTGTFNQEDYCLDASIPGTTLGTWYYDSEEGVPREGKC